MFAEGKHAVGRSTLRRWAWVNAVGGTWQADEEIGVGVQLGSQCVKALPFQLIAWDKQLREEYGKVSPSAHLG